MSDPVDNGIPKSVLKALPTGFLEEAEAMDEKALRELVVASEGNIRETEREREADEKLQGAKSIVKDLVGPYRDAIKAQRAKIACAMYFLEGRGVL